MLAFVVIEFSYLRFHTLFTRGPKVRLFCSPQCYRLKRCSSKDTNIVISLPCDFDTRHTHTPSSYHHPVISTDTITCTMTYTHRHDIITLGRALWFRHTWRYCMLPKRRFGRMMAWTCVVRPDDMMMCAHRLDDDSTVCPMRPCGKQHLRNLPELGKPINEDAT